jgi:uncharacterized membrane protein
MTEPFDAQHARSRLPVEILVAAVVVLLAGWLFKSHCYFDGSWDDGEQYTVGCYTDVVPFWTARGVAEGAMPYLEAPLEYPVLTGAQIWLEGEFSRLLLAPGAGALVFLTVVTLVNAGLAVGILALLHRMGVPRRRLWWWALAPAIVLYVGHNWDLLAMFLAVLAIDLHRRGQAARAGVALGLGTAAKLFPALLAPLFLLAHLRRRELPQLVATAGYAAVAWLVVNLPVAVAVPQRWAEFYVFSQERPGTYAATWTVLQDIGLLTTSVAQRNLLASAGFALGAVVIVWAGWKRYRGYEWALITPLVAWFLLTNKVWSPQFDLWLIPLLVLTASRLRPVVMFALADIGVYLLEFWWLARLQDWTPSASYGSLAIAAGVRAGVLIGIIVLALRDGPPAWMTPATEEDVAAEETVGADSR